MASRNVADLHPACRALWAKFDAEMRAAKQDYILTCTFRDNAEQAALYAQGRNGRPGAIVTNARPGESAHNVMIDGKPAACAFDIAIVSNGKIDWNPRDAGWQQAGKLGLIVGLDWAGVWTSFREYPHFQLSNWKDIRNGILSA